MSDDSSSNKKDKKKTSFAEFLGIRRRNVTEEEILDMLHKKEFVLYKTSFISLLYFLRNHNGAFTHKDPTKNK